MAGHMQFMGRNMNADGRAPGMAGLMSWTDDYDIGASNARPHLNTSTFQYDLHWQPTHTLQTCCNQSQRLLISAATIQQCAETLHDLYFLIGNP